MPRIHDIDVQRLTPLGRLIDSYAQRQRPRLSTISAIAHALGMMPNTAKSLLYSDHEPSAKTLRKVISRTGLPAETVYGAITPPLSPPLAPPVPRDSETRRAQPQLVEGDAPYAALEDFMRRVRSFNMSEEAKQELIETTRQALQSALGTLSVPVEPPPPWDDHDAVSTLQLSTVTAPPLQQERNERESQPVGK